MALAVAGPNEHDSVGPPAAVGHVHAVDASGAGDVAEQQQQQRCADEKDADDNKVGKSRWRSWWPSRATCAAATGTSRNRTDRLQSAIRGVAATFVLAAATAAAAAASPAVVRTRPPCLSQPRATIGPALAAERSPHARRPRPDAGIVRACRCGTGATASPRRRHVSS